MITNNEHESPLEFAVKEPFFEIFRNILLTYSPEHVRNSELMPLKNTINNLWQHNCRVNGKHFNQIENKTKESVMSQCCCNEELEQFNGDDFLVYLDAVQNVWCFLKKCSVEMLPQIAKTFETAHLENVFDLYEIAWNLRTQYTTLVDYILLLKNICAQGYACDMLHLGRRLRFILTKYIYAPYTPYKGRSKFNDLCMGIILLLDLYLTHKQRINEEPQYIEELVKRLIKSGHGKNIINACVHEAVSHFYRTKYESYSNTEVSLNLQQCIDIILLLIQYDNALISSVYLHRVVDSDYEECLNLLDYY